MVNTIKEELSLEESLRKKITEYDKKIASKEKELLREEQKLSKAKEDEYKQIERQRKIAIDNLSSDLYIQRESQNKLIKEVDK